MIIYDTFKADASNLRDFRRIRVDPTKRHNIKYVKVSTLTPVELEMLRNCSRTVFVSGFSCEQVRRVIAVDKFVDRPIARAIINYDQEMIVFQDSSYSEYFNFRVKTTNITHSRARVIAVKITIIIILRILNIRTRFIHEQKITPLVNSDSK